MKIENSVVMPENPRRQKYPFVDMEPGQSVFFPGAKVGGKEYLASQACGRNKGWKFAGRSVDGGVRIWRVE